MKHDEVSVIVRQIVADNIRSFRNECGHSQAKFAEMINVNRSYLNQIELAKENVSLDILVKIADGLDRPIADFFKGLESCPPRELTCGSAKQKSGRRKTSGSEPKQKAIRYRFVELPFGD